MDANIRTLILLARKDDGDSSPVLLNEAYELLKKNAECEQSSDSPDSFGSDLYVLCAETAFQRELYTMCETCLQLFYARTPPANQFMCRAYLTQAQLLVLQDPLNPEQLEKANIYITKAVNFAKETPRYHFLVYNASVLYWHFCRPFLKPKSRRHVARGLHMIVKALDDIDEKDHEWRAQLMIALIECHLDAGRQADAAHIATVASTFIKQNVPHMYREIFGLVVRHQLADAAKIQKDIKSSPELAVYHKVCHLKAAIESPDSDINPANELNRLIHFITKGEDPNKLQPPEIGRSGRRSPSISPRASEGEKSRPRGRLRRSESIFEASLLTFNTTPILPKNSVHRPRLLLDLARLSLDQNQATLCQAAVNGIADCHDVEAGLLLELEFVKAELRIRKLGPKQDSFQKAVVDIRLQAVKHCEEALMNAIRLGDANVIQAGCVSQWNLCLPLLQPNLRHYVRRPLTLVAEALEDMDSLWRLLRCQIHTEVAKCEEDEEQVPVAMDHIKKALILDDERLYQERLETMLHRLELRAQLYQQPERPEDQAAMIIEQARHSNTGTLRMKRALLCRAGEALAPDAFILVLDSESDTKASASGNKGPVTVFKTMAAKAKQFNNCVVKAEGHLKRLGSENDRERVCLWADLAKTARKQEVWDVCRVASRFCLLYDDGRWKVPPPPVPEITKKKNARPAPTPVTEDVTPDSEAKSESPPPKPAKLPPGKGAEPEVEAAPPGVVLYEKDLIRMLAEVHFINGEALIHLSRSEKVQLLDAPIPPEDKSKKPKGHVAKKPEEDPDWNSYCSWISDLSTWALDAFLRGMDLGQELTEPWIVCCAATYVWNYSNHILQQRRHREMLETMQKLFDGLVKIGHAGETQLFTSLCTALATAYLLPWLPKPPEPQVEKPPSATPGKKKPGSARKTGTAPVSSGATIDPEATPDLKRALEVCTYAIDVTNGTNPQEVVPVCVRHPLLQTWVLVKQMLQQQVGKQLGCEDADNQEGQRPMTRSLVAVEMLSLQTNGIMEFKDIPPMTEVLSMVENCDWTDKLVELQLWTRLTYLAYQDKDHESVTWASKMALRFAHSGTQPANRKVDGHKYMVEQEMLSYAACLLGQSLVDVMAGSNSIRRQAMDAFLASVNHGHNAGNYALTMTASRHYWNVIMPLVSQPMERDLLKKPLQVILESVADLADKKATSPETKSSVVPASSVSAPVVGGATGQHAVTEGAPGGDSSDDLTIRAAMYGVLFQSYADKGEWEDGIRCMDDAIDSMPRTNHRLLLFKHRVIVKAKLGRSVLMDLQKFKDESESDMADMWRKVALCSRDQTAQLVGYQNAVESLTLPENIWQKYDYLLEFAQWLYVHDFPTWSSVDLCQWAADLLLNMVFQTAPTSAGKKRTSASAKTKKDKSKKEKGKKSPTSPKPESPVKVTLGGATTVGGGAEKHESDAESEVPAGMEYIPVARKSEIGVLPTNPNLAINDLNDVRQLEGLVRSHVLMAQISGQRDDNFLQFCLQAYGFIVRIWKVSLAAAGPVIKEMAKNPPVPEKDAKGGKGKKETKEKEQPVKERPKRKGPVDAVPATVEDWATYDAPDEVLEAYKQEMMKSTGVNEKTFTKPALTYHYLDLLVTYLRDLGYNQLVLPVLALCELLSRDLMKNRALNALVHVRSMEVCLELNLLNAVNFHQSLAGSFNLVPEEQAQVRVALARWQEQKSQVAMEEAKVQESMQRLTESKSGKTKSTLPSRMEEKVEGVDLPVVTKEIGPIRLEDVWVDTAEVMIRQGIYQPAREMLREAFIVAEGFDDNCLKSRILALMAKLSHSEAQYGQAAKYCRQAQDTYKGDEMFWYETTMLLVDCIQHDTGTKEPHRQARGYLRYAVGVFKEIAESRPNKNSITGYILTKLDEKFADVQTEMAYDKLKKKLLTISDARQSLQSAHEKYLNCAERLLALGRSRDAVRCQQKAAAILHEMATRMYQGRADRHALYLMALSVIQKAVSLSQQILHDSVGILKPPEMKSCNLPVSRETADTKLQSAHIMIDLYQTHTREIRDMKETELKKPQIVKMVEELTAETPELTRTELRWDDVTDHVVESAMTHLMDAHALSSHVPRLRARCLCLVGKCLRLVSEHKGPDAPATWDFNAMEVLEVEASMGGEPEIEEAPEVDREAPEFLEKQELLARLKAELGESHQYLTQCTEILCQAVNVSLKEGYRDLCADASLQLLECCGQYDASLAASLLMLHQSCESSLHLESLLYKSQPDPLTSQQAALLHQRRLLAVNDLTTNSSRGPTVKNILATLEKESLAWKRLSVGVGHLDILKEFPSNFNFVVLQHAPDRLCLYGAIFDRPKSGSKTSNPKHGSQLQAPNKTRVVRIPTSADKLDRLLSRFGQHKLDVMQILLKLEYQRSQAANRQKMLANLSEEPVDEDMLPRPEDEEEEETLQEDFDELMELLEEYLKPLMLHIEHLHRPGTSTTVHSAKEKEKEKEKETAATQELFVLLVDHWLMELPLEALRSLQAETVGAICREISVQFMSHRLLQDVVDEAEKKAREKVKPPSRIPGARDAGLKKAKVIPLDRSVPQGCVPVNTSDFRYFVDPHRDCSENETAAPIKIFEDILEEHSQQFTARWLGVTGNEHIPRRAVVASRKLDFAAWDASVGEYEIYLSESSSLIYYGTEKLLTHIPPDRLAALAIPECMIAILCDLAQTSKSFLRQSKVDIHKTQDHLSLEKSVETALLLSLSGVKCVLANQWACTLAENGTRMTQLARDLLASGMTTGQTIRLQYCPYRRKLEPSEEAPAAGDGAETEVEHEVEEKIRPLRQWYNMVCYGLPNVMVTLLH